MNTRFSILKLDGDDFIIIDETTGEFTTVNAPGKSLDEVLSLINDCQNILDVMSVFNVI